MSEIRVENIIGETGVDAVKFTKGVNVTGIVTATSVSATNVSIGSSVTATNFFGSGASLTGISADYVKLQAVYSSSAVADLTFDSLDLTTYRTFKMVFSGYPSSDASELYFRFRSGGADKSNSGTYNWGNVGVTGAGSVYDNAASDSKAYVGYNAGNNNYEGWRFELTVVPRSSADVSYQNNFGYVLANRYTESNSHRGETFWFKFHQADAVDGFKIYPQTGNIAAYEYTLYGLKR